MGEQKTEVTCEGCGVCCMHVSVPPYNEQEKEWLKKNEPAVYGDLMAVRRSQYRFSQAFGDALHFSDERIPCGWFDLVTGQCRHHEHKPEVCRDFEVGGGGCLDFRKRAGLE